VHVHVSALAALNVFLGVLIIGTLFRIVTLHLVASSNPTVSRLGQAMAFQY
jgi:hypothetical protein